ncbi:hypothetical protein ACQP1W_37670 [Spirillospora sp. CA-255316]
MSEVAKRGGAAAGTVAIAAAVNVATGMLTQKWALAWGIAVAVLVVVGGALQAWLTVSGQPPRRNSDEESGRRGSGGQSVQGARVGRTLKQSLHGTGEQSVIDSDVGGDLHQTQRHPRVDGG